MAGELLTLIKIKEGNIGAFEDLFRTWYSPLFFYSMSITGRPDVSEEIVQELFYQIWKNREKLQIMKTLKSYLYGAVKNRSIQYIQRERTRAAGEDPEHSTSAREDTDPQQCLEYKELEEIINKTMKKMPPRRLKIFMLHREENKKYAEIAGDLSLSVKTVEAEIGKALKALRKEIECYTTTI